MTNISEADIERLGKITGIAERPGSMPHYTHEHGSVDYSTDPPTITWFDLT